MDHELTAMLAAMLAAVVPAAGAALSGDPAAAGQWLLSMASTPAGVAVAASLPIYAAGRAVLRVVSAWRGATLEDRIARIEALAEQEDA